MTAQNADDVQWAANMVKKIKVEITHTPPAEDMRLVAAILDRHYQSVCDYLGCDHGPEQVAEEIVTVLARRARAVRQIGWLIWETITEDQDAWFAVEMDYEDLHHYPHEPLFVRAHIDGSGRGHPRSAQGTAHDPEKGIAPSEALPPAAHVRLARFTTEVRAALCEMNDALAEGRDEAEVLDVTLARILTAYQEVIK